MPMRNQARPTSDYPVCDGRQSSVTLAALVAAEAAVNLGKAMSRFLFMGGAPDQSRAFNRMNAPEQFELMDRRLNKLEASIASIENRTASLEIQVERKVDREQLDLEIRTAVEAAFLPLMTDNERRFAIQAEAVQALKAMISRTDELLGRVLEHLESPLHSNAA